MPVNGWENWFSLQVPCGVGAEGVVAQRAVRADQDRGAEGLAVVGRVRLVDVAGAVGGERRPGHVDPVAERAAGCCRRSAVACRAGSAGAGDVVVLDHGAAREVPGRAVGAGGAVHVERAGLVGVGGGGGPRMNVWQERYALPRCPRRPRCRRRPASTAGRRRGAPGEAVGRGGVGQLRPASSEYDTPHVPSPRR